MLVEKLSDEKEWEQFAGRGVKCLGVDVDEEKIRKINKGDMPIENIEYWLGFDASPLVKSGMMKVTTDLVVSDHREYQATPRKQILDNLKKCKLVLNNTEIWHDKNFEELGIEYHVAGTRGWLS